MIITERAQQGNTLHRLGNAGLAEQIEAAIESKALGRIRDLRVLCTETVVILRGRARTYHAKQLAHEAALDWTNGRIELSNQITIY
jgi:hypothetical protein